MRKIRVALADDSAFLRKALSRLLLELPQIDVVGTAATGEELLGNIESWQPDVIILDLFMPGIGGMETLRRIMDESPRRVIIMSSHSQQDAPLTIEALHRGAVDFIDKQKYSLVDFGALRDVLAEKIVGVMHGSLIVRKEPAATRPVQRKPGGMPPSPSGAFDLVLIGASTGGPPAIQDILTQLCPLPVPIAIVQHMPEGFTRPFAERLNNQMAARVTEATHGELLLPGVVYIAPAGQHLKVKRDDSGRLAATLATFPDTVAHRPSVDILFRSAIPVARRTVAALLTGMGSDGAQGMAELAQAGAFTIAQDEATCVVYGMPRAAVELHAARVVLPLHDIAERIRTLVG